MTRHSPTTVAFVGYGCLLAAPTRPFVCPSTCSSSLGCGQRGYFSSSNGGTTRGFVTASGTDCSGRDPFYQLEHANWQKGFEAYDAGFGPLTRQVIPTLLEKCNFPPSGEDESRPRFLDVATGPGYVVSAAIDAACAAASSAPGRNDDVDFTALDFSSNFLTMARGRIESDRTPTSSAGAAAAPAPSVAFVEGNAEAMPFLSSAFSSVACNFGILHLSRPEDFLREAYRCLRPGGRLSFSVWSPPPATEGFDMILNSVSTAGNPDVPLPAGPPFFRYANPVEARKALESLGFIDVDVTELTELEWSNVESGAELYQIMSEGTARTRALLEGQTEEESKAVRAELDRRFRARNGGCRSLRMGAVVASGSKPMI